jgi:hypothetical protein
MKSPDDIVKIQTLEKQVQELKIENANLKENQVLMNA